MNWASYGDKLRDAAWARRGLRVGSRIGKTRITNFVPKLCCVVHILTLGPFVPPASVTIYLDSCTSRLHLACTESLKGHSAAWVTLGRLFFWLDGVTVLLLFSSRSAKFPCPAFHPFSNNVHENSLVTFSQVSNARSRLIVSYCMPAGDSEGTLINYYPTT